MIHDGEEPEAIPYARWVPAHGERSAREHLAARRAEMQQHVIDALYEPDGKSRVSHCARCILSSQIPELPAQPAAELLRPESERQSGTVEVERAVDAMCVQCE